MEDEVRRERAVDPKGSGTHLSAEALGQDPERRVQRMGQIAREIGHDLNNCLGVVGGRAELLVMHLDRGDSEGARRGVEVILKQMDRMKELSNALRELRHRP